eukprot:11171932-Lingulodinium_polyedra.AAC.1
MAAPAATLNPCLSRAPPSKMTMTGASASKRPRLPADPSGTVISAPARIVRGRKARQQQRQLGRRSGCGV